MFRRAASAYHWVKAWDDNRIHGPEAALRRIARMEALCPLSYVATAYKAFLLFHSGRTDEANKLFETVELRLTPPKNANEAYVQLFCQFFGRYAVSRLEVADGIWTAAQELKCSGMLRRYLPFYRKPSIINQDPRFAHLPTSPLLHRYHRQRDGA